MDGETEEDGDSETLELTELETDDETLVEGDPRMFNPYGVIAVNPQRYPTLNNQGAMALVNWLTSAEGREAIAAFRINGVQMFFPTPK